MLYINQRLIVCLAKVNLTQGDKASNGLEQKLFSLLLLATGPQWTSSLQALGRPPAPGGLQAPGPPQASGPQRASSLQPLAPGRLCSPSGPPAGRGPPASPFSSQSLAGPWPPAGSKPLMSLTGYRPLASIRPLTGCWLLASSGPLDPGRPLALSWPHASKELPAPATPRAPNGPLAPNSPNGSLVR